MSKDRFIGLALGERRIVAAEVASSRGGAAVVRAAAFAFAEGDAWERPQELGGRLGEFLREHGVTCTTAVVGVPAGWLVTARHEVPPVNAQALADLLRLAVGQVFSLPPEELVCDYASAPPSGQAGSVLLVGIRRDRLQAVAECARSAGLKVRAVTSTAAVLALSETGTGGRVIVHPTPDGMDVVLASDGKVRALCHVPLADASGPPAVLALYLGIQSVLAPADGDVERIAMYDGMALDQGAVHEAGERLGMQIATESALPLSGLAEAATAAGIPAGSAAAAAALALGGMSPRTVPFDLGARRLAEPTVHRWRLWGRPSALLLVAVLVVVGALVADREGRKGEVAFLRTKLDTMDPLFKSARDVVDAVTGARGWYDRRPPLLGCLVGLTQAFPEEGRIWATSLAVREDMHGVVTGNAASEEAVLGVLDAMKASKQFLDVKLIYSRETRATASERAFSVSFTYVGGQ